MKKKLLAEAVVLATLVAVMLSVGLVEASGVYSPSATRTGDGSGHVSASNWVLFNDEYVINVGMSNVYTDYGIYAGTSSLQEVIEMLNTVNSWAYIEAEFYPTYGADYGMWAEAWTYPSYTQNPCGASSDKWYL